MLNVNKLDDVKATQRNISLIPFEIEQTTHDTNFQFVHVIRTHMSLLTNKQQFLNSLLNSRNNICSHRFEIEKKSFLNNSLEIKLSIFDNKESI